MPKESKDVTLIHLDIEAIDCFESIAIYFAEVFKFKQSFLAFLIFMLLVRDLFKVTRLFFLLVMKGCLGFIKFYLFSLHSKAETGMLAHATCGQYLSQVDTN